MEKIRVLVVDDSACMRKVLSNILASQPDIEVVATARDGLDALEKVALLDPDVVTLDVEMPRLDGLRTLERIMAERPRPVVMVSSLTQAGAEATVRALALGAVDFVTKPSGAAPAEIFRVREELWRKVRVAARAGKGKAWGRPPAMVAGWRRGGSTAAPPRGTGQLSRLVVIGASTGGPGALMEVIPRLPEGFPAGILLVQHMPAGFTRSLAQHLNDAGALPVREAGDGDALSDGVCLVAPGGRHATIDGQGRVVLLDTPPQHGVKPAVDVALEGIPERWARNAVVVILTGMGVDGARGARRVRSLGGCVIAQDEATSVVYGMPRATVELGAADHVLPLHEIAGMLCHLVGEPAVASGAVRGC